MSYTKSTYLVLLLVVPFFSACQCTPSLSLAIIAESDNSFYIRTSPASFSPIALDIRTFDLEKEKWGKINQAKSFIQKDADGSIIAADKGSVLRLNQGKSFSHVFDLPKGASLIGADKDFFYLLVGQERSEPTNKGLRYSKKKSTFLEYHFDHNKNLIVADICEGNDFYWFVCFDVSLQTKYFQKKKRYLSGGPIVLVSKSKQDGSIEEYQFNDQIWSKAQCINGKEAVWLFAGPSIEDWKGKRWLRAKHLIKFSKKSKEFDLKKEKRFNLKHEIFPNQYISDEEPYIWAVNERRLWASKGGGQSIVKINTKTMESETTLLALPPDFLQRSARTPDGRTPVFYGALYSDENFLWLAAEKSTHYGLYSRHTRVPYLLRVSKDDMSYKLIKMSPTVGEAMGRFSARYILEPILYPIAMFLFWLGGP